jgi:acetyltransferase-like isoleucine patch superfamily enzyme
MRWAGYGRFGRFACGCAGYFAPPHMKRVALSSLNPKGYISPSAIIHYSDLTVGKHLFMDDRAVLYQRMDGKSALLGDKVRIYRDTIIETGYGGSIEINDDVSLHPRCQIMAYVEKIRIGKGTMVAPNCAFYCYDHDIIAGQPIREQGFNSKGMIDVGEEAWISVGVTILSGVTIGPGAVIGAGAVVTKDIPSNAVAVGNPAKVIGYRSR